MGSSLINRNTKTFVSNREIYLRQLKGLPFGGKRHSRDRRKYYKPMFIEVYEVQPGDTFKSIGEKEKALESRPLEIATMNGLKHSDSLVPGKFLKVVKKGIYEPKKYLFLESENIPKKGRVRR